MFQQQEINGQLWLNPGCGYKRGTPALSMAVMMTHRKPRPPTLETIYGWKRAGTPRCHHKAGKTRKKKKQVSVHAKKRHVWEKKDKRMLFLITKILQSLSGRCFQKPGLLKIQEMTQAYSKRFYDLCAGWRKPPTPGFLARVRGRGSRSQVSFLFISV